VAPWSVEAWGSPTETLPLAALRLVGWAKAGGGGGESGSSSTAEATGTTGSINGAPAALVITIRCGTPRGVVQRSLRAETHRDLATWAEALVSGAHEAVMQQKEFVFRKYDTDLLIYFNKYMDIILFTSLIFLFI
jgi:beta-syntrophin